KRYTRVRVTAADGKTTYHVRDAVGRLSALPFDVRVLFSKRHPRARSWAYFASTDLARSVVETLRGYGGRWSCEVVNFSVRPNWAWRTFACGRMRRWNGMWSRCIWPGPTWNSGWLVSDRLRSGATAR